MNKEYIEVKGARENNLKDVSLRIPKRKITVFTGVSGSGKSSLVFDTLAAEAQRQLNETFTAFVRNFLPSYGQPDADAIENLSTAVIVDQKRLGGNSRSTLGTVTDIHPMLRLLFSRIGKPSVGYSNAFSFNDPAGMCPECSGIGTTAELDLRGFFDTSRSLNEGAMLHQAFAVGGWYWKLYAHSGLFDNDKKLDDYTVVEWDTLLYGKGSKVELKTPSGPTVRSDFEDVVDKFTRLYVNKDMSGASHAASDALLRFRCASCEGTRLNPAALSCKIDGYNIADLAGMDLDSLTRFVSAVSDPIAAPTAGCVSSEPT